MRAVRRYAGNAWAIDASEDCDDALARAIDALVSRRDARASEIAGAAGGDDPRGGSIDDRACRIPVLPFIPCVLRRADLVVAGRLVVELEALPALAPVPTAQVISP